MAGVTQTAKDYAGLAALVTAIGGVGGMFLNQLSHQDESNQVQDSVFAVLQYRVDQLEARCLPARAAGGGVGYGRTLPQALPAPAEDDSPVTATVESGEPPKALPSDHKAIRAQIHEQLKGNRPLVLDDIRSYVQKAGKALDVDF